MQRAGSAGGSSALCPLCARPTPKAELAEAGWATDDVRARIAERHPGWQTKDGACPACVQESLLELLLEKGEEALHEGVQKAWPFDPEAAFGTLPTPLRLHAHPRYTGRGVTLAVVDAAFHPHPDLVGPPNRIRAWVDASREPVRVLRFEEGEIPDWPGATDLHPAQWHGLMTSAAAAGDGRRSHGLYRGLAPEAQLVLVQVRDDEGRIRNPAIARALDWLRWWGPELGVRVVNLSLGGDPVDPLAGNAVDEAVAALVAEGITVVVAAGNDGHRSLVPPGTAPEALTIGGLDDRNTYDHHERRIWHSNYGESGWGTQKPELVAPSLFVVAPLLPGSELAAEAVALFAARAAGDPEAEPRLAELRLVTPHYQHVEGTSFAAPIVSGIVAAMLEANPTLHPRRIRELLVRAAQPVPGADVERQGAGAIDAGRAVNLALADRFAEDGAVRSPAVSASDVAFILHEPRVRAVSVVGSWDGWQKPGAPAEEAQPGLWRVSLPRPRPGRHHYKFLLDEGTWLADPGNPFRAHDGHGGWNSLLVS